MNAKTMGQKFIDCVAEAARESKRLKYQFVLKEKSEDLTEGFVRFYDDKLMDELVGVQVFPATRGNIAWVDLQIVFSEGPAFLFPLEPRHQYNLVRTAQECNARLILCRHDEAVAVQGVGCCFPFTTLNSQQVDYLFVSLYVAREAVSNFANGRPQEDFWDSEPKLEDVSYPSAQAGSGSFTGA